MHLVLYLRRHAGTEDETLAIDQWNSSGGAVSTAVLVPSREALHGAQAAIDYLTGSAELDARPMPSVS